MKEYGKTSKNNEELADLLMGRGLVADRSALLRVLETVGYYRFSGYLVPFRDRDSENYRTGTKLDEDWGIYMFDRHLREEYGIEDCPPVWMMMELVPMGTVTSYYHGLSDSVQKHVADVFHVRPNVFGQSAGRASVV